MYIHQTHHCTMTHGIITSHGFTVTHERRIILYNCVWYFYYNCFYVTLTWATNQIVTTVFTSWFHHVCNYSYFIISQEFFPRFENMYPFYLVNYIFFNSHLLTQIYLTYFKQKKTIFENCSISFIKKYAQIRFFFYCMQASYKTL